MYRDRVPIVSTGFRTDLMILRWSGSEIMERQDHLVIRTPNNPNFWWGNYLLLAEPLAPGAGDYWRRRFREEFPGASHFALGIDGTNGTAGDPPAIQDLGMDVGIDTVLIAEHLHEAPEVDAVIRPIQSDHDWQQMEVHRAAMDEHQAAGAQLHYLRRRLLSDRRMSEAGHGSWFGVFDGTRLVSTAGIFTDGSGESRYQSVMTDPAHRRRGLASAVVEFAGKWAQTHQQVKRLVIVADPAHDAIRIYRKLGFVEAEKQVGLQHV